LFEDFDEFPCTNLPLSFLESEIVLEMTSLMIVFFQTLPLNKTVTPAKTSHVVIPGVRARIGVAELFSVEIPTVFDFFAVFGGAPGGLQRPCIA